MKKLIILFLTISLLLCGCGVEEPTVTETTTPVITEEVKAQLDAVLQQHKFEGIVSLTHNGEVVYQSVSGTNDLGEPLTIESPMYIGSISKQFCATAILMLRDQGKLSLDDTLDVYFPEYTIGKDITLHQLMCMRSGITRDIVPMWTETEQYMGQNKEENTAAFKEWVFAQPLIFEPNGQFEYCNINYTLLSFIVEDVSGMAYPDFLRQNILEPLDMTHTGFISEVREGSERTSGLTYDNVKTIAQLPIGIQGCGDIISTAADMDIWMTSLSSGKVVCKESYQEMTTDYSPEFTQASYGYGLMGGIRNGWSHGGNIGCYATMMYFNPDYGYNLYINSNLATTSYFADISEKTSKDFLRVLFTAVDGAAKG